MGNLINIVDFIHPLVRRAKIQYYTADGNTQFVFNINSSIYQFTQNNICSYSLESGTTKAPWNDVYNNLEVTRWGPPVIDGYIE